MKDIKILNNLDLKTVLRALTIALLLFLDASVGRLRSLPPLYLFYGIFIIILLTAWWVWKMIHKRGIVQTPISFPLIIYLSAVTLSTFFSVDLRRSLDGLLATTVVVLLFFLICDLILSGWKPDVFIWALLIFVTILLIQGLGEIFNWYWSFFSLRVPEYPTFLLRYRLFGISAWPSKLVMLIYISIPFVIFKLFESKSIWKKIFWVTWLLIAEIIFVFSDTRGGMVAGLFVLGITLGWLLFREGMPRKRNLRNWLSSKRKYFGVLTAFTLAYILISMIRQLSPHTGTTHHGGGISAGRLNFWQVALDIFKNYPIIGSGPITYPRFYIQDFPSGIYGWVSPHAHNFILNTGAQLGVLGLLALGLVIFSLFFYSVRSPKAHSLILKEPTNPESFLLIGVAAALTGVLIHSNLDRLEETPHTMIPLLILVGVGLHTLNLIKSPGKLDRKFASVFFIFPIFATVILIRQNNSQLSQLNSLQSAYQDNWSEAASFTNQAVDLDPGMNFYNEQRGFAYGALALSLESNDIDNEISEAIRSYQIANEMFPYWAPNYVNLAELYDKAGKPEEALKTLESIPQDWFRSWPFPALILAEEYQESGQLSKADELLQKALNYNYWVKDMAICQRSIVCKEIAAQIQIEEGNEYFIHSDAISLLKDGFPKITLNRLKEIPPEKSSALIWVDRAAAHCALYEYPQCEYSLEVAERLNVGNQPQSAAHYALTKSNFLRQQGKDAEAMKILESHIRPLVKIKNYENVVYQRVGFPNPLLPSLSILEKNALDLVVYRELAELYKQANMFPDAIWAENQAELLSVYFEEDAPY